MRLPMSWLRDYADVPVEVSAREVGDALVRAGLEVEGVETVGDDVTGVVVGEVLDVEELVGFKKPIRYCAVEVGEFAPRGVVCGASNFRVGDRVPVALPGAVLPGGFQIAARTTYGRVSDGMICSARELGLGEDHTGILVLDPTLPSGADAVAALGLRDQVLDITVTPDRGYCWSVRGLAREAAIAFGVDFRDPALVPLPAAHGPAYEVRVEDPAGCDRYTARLVTGLDPAATTPLELRRRLLLAGMRPISLPVDVTNIVLLGLGQPLHAFDRDRLTGAIVVRRGRAGEQLRTLDGTLRTLDPDDLLITDDSGPIALAGVMGGGPTEISPGTSSLVLESAHFDPATVARTARRHRLATEASRRYERGVDDDLAAHAAEVAVRMLVDLGGADAPARATDVDARPPRPTISLSSSMPGRVAGRPYDEAVVRRRLLDVGCAVAGEEPLAVTPPSWRPDLTSAIDLADEVVRLEGYDTVPSVLPLAPGGRGLTPRQRLRRRLAEALAAAGYVETPTSPFVAASGWDAVGVASAEPGLPALELLNPLDEAERWLRTSLLPGLLTALARNTGRGTADLGLYETGAVFFPRPGTGPAPAPPPAVRPSATELAALDAALPPQPQHVAVVLAGAREAAGPWGPGRPAGWADAVEAGRLAGRALGLHLDLRQAQAAPWHPGRCAALTLGDAVVGHAGELHPRVIDALSLPGRTCAMELDLEPLFAVAPEVLPATPISGYPAATLDVALVVERDVPAGRVEAALRAGAGHLLEGLRLFDVYTGPQVGDGRRSLAYALRLRAPDRTLTSEEALVVRDAAVASAARETGAVLRG